MKNFLKTLIIGAILSLLPSAASAADIYFAPTSAGAANGTSCANAYAYNDGTHGWNQSAEQVAGNILHVCAGTYNIAANGIAMQATNSGTSGNPITFFFESGAVIQSPHFSNGYGGGPGGLNVNGVSWWVIDGNHVGMIQNTLTGSSGATCPGGPCTFQVTSGATTGISMVGCNNCILQNLTIANIDINKSPDTSQTPQQAQAVTIDGSNVSILNNNIHDCGWCVNFFYNGNVTGYVVSGNTGSNFTHFVALASTAVVDCTNPCLIFSGNQVTAGTNWSVPGGGAACNGNHVNGLHLFAENPSAAVYQDGIYVYNNYWYGDWGACVDGFIYTDNSGSSPGVRTQWIYNNVGIIVDTVEQTNGYLGLGGSLSPSGNQFIYNNTLLGNGQNDNTICFRLGNGSSNLHFNNNVSVGCGTPISTQNPFPAPISMDYNVYSAGSGGVGFSWDDGFQGSFGNWKSACNCDIHSIGTSTLGQYTSSGAPVSSSTPTVKWGLNFGSIASGLVASIANDTTLGGTRTALARPSAGSCTSQGSLPCWDVGAIQQAGSASNPPAPPTNVHIVVQ